MPPQSPQVFGARVKIWILFLGLALPILSSSAAPHVAPRNGLLTSGKYIFVTRCSLCHGIDGRGGERAPNIATNPNIQHLSQPELSNIVENGIPAMGMPAFKTLLGPADVHSVVDYLRSLQGERRSVTKVPGNSDHGKQLFYGAAHCSTCHMINGKGGFLGPELSDYASTHSLQQIREAIVNPNKNLPREDDTVIVVTRDGCKLVGIARDEDNFSLQLQTSDGAFHLLTKADLKELRYDPRSLMPSDYGSLLSDGELTDLISFLVTTIRTRTTTNHGTKHPQKSLR